jgi:RNA polymerase sigma-B factor
MSSTALRTSASFELLVAYQKNPSIEIRNKLVRLNAGLVRKVAHRMTSQCNETFEDLEQVGYMGLIRAVERFDPTQGNAFSSFAVPYIRGEMLHYLRDCSGTVKIPRRLQDLQSATKRVRRALSEKLNRQPKDDEVLAELNICDREWQDLKLSYANRSLVSLDMSVNTADGSAASIGELLSDSQVEKLLKWEEERVEIQLALSNLEERTRKMIELVYIHRFNRKVVGEQLGVSPMTVSRNLKKGIEDLKANLLKASVQSHFEPSL